MPPSNISLDLAYQEYTKLLWAYQKARHDYEAGDADIEDVYDVLERLKRRERVIEVSEKLP